jgi:hypothetical protein
MLPPAHGLTLRLPTLRRAADFALAEYRHAWEYGTSDDLDELHRQVCKAVAPLRVYEQVTRPGTPMLGSTDVFWTLAARYAENADFRRSMRFPDK